MHVGVDTHHGPLSSVDSKTLGCFTWEVHPQKITLSQDSQSGKETCHPSGCASFSLGMSCLNVFCDARGHSAQRYSSLGAGSWKSHAIRSDQSNTPSFHPVPISDLETAAHSQALLFRTTKTKMRMDLLQPGTISDRKARDTTRHTLVFRKVCLNIRTPSSSTSFRRRILSMAFPLKQLMKHQCKPWPSAVSSL